ncbi:MAG: hypothetical protein KME29_04630 [Calothrix sp. FI2-JRJ7]|jgi:hypothetical protein|nr:hypothetical protein [Calothrix sp. FI2-JRJ7]
MTQQPQTYQQRVRQIIELRCQANTNPEIAQTLNSLEQGDFSARILALQSCYGSYDGALILRTLNDTSQGVRSLAMRLVAKIADDTQVQIALNTATFKQRRYIIKELLKRYRRNCIDTFLNNITNTDTQFGRLLPYASTELVERHIETAIELYGISDWRLLARLHPQIVSNLLLKQASDKSDFDPRLASQVNAVLPTLSELFPETALSICRAVYQIIPISKLNLQSLLIYCPQEVAELILSSDDKANINFDNVAHKLETQQLIRLITTRKNTINSQNILPLLAPEQREIVYNTFVDSWRDNKGCLTPKIISYLPRHIREQEAQYHLNLPALITLPFQRIPYAAFLPWLDARAFLEEYIRDPEPELRKLALSALVFATRYNRSNTVEILNIVKQRRNEQDPIRGAMITALAALPPSIWHFHMSEDLSQIIADALNAADLSNATATATERLVINILPFHPAWSAQQLATFVQQRGQVSFYNLGNKLSNTDVSRIAPSLLPVLQSWETRERESNIVAAARSFGRRLKVFDGLVEILERIINDTKNNYIASEALSLIAEHRRDGLNELIPQLLQQDPSWITQYIVYDFVHRRRQDLITPFLGQQAYSGRFSTGKTRFILPFTNGFYRWTTQQQEIFQKTLEEVTQDDDRDIPTLLRVIRQLAALPAVQPTRLLELASHNNSKLAVRDAALYALPHLDTPHGIPVLIEAMNDDRARIAIYALRSLLLQMPTNQALQTLRAVPLNKVTVAKEVVRLLGELPSEEAYIELLSWNERNLHRDVRVAFLRALWNHLERDATWPILKGAATSCDTAIAKVVGRLPTDKLSQNAQKKFLELLVLLLNHPDPVIRSEILQRCYDLTISDSEKILFPTLQQRINSSLFEESSLAINAVLTTYKNSADVIGATIQSILPNRRNLTEATKCLSYILTWERQQTLPTARAVIEIMTSDPLTTCLQVKLAVCALPWDELATFFQQLAVSEKMHPQALLTASNEITIAQQRNDAHELVQLEEILAPSEDDKLRYIALTALITQSQVLGWNSERISRLYAFRNDPSAMVAEKAQFTFLPDTSV